MGLLLKIRNKLSLPIGHALIGQRAGDQFLASYPRSGSTWMRTMLVNIMVPDANSNPDVFNAVIPGVSIRQVPRIRRQPSPRIMHTHTYYRPEIARVVYTVRDGRDVLISFYHYLVTRRGAKMPFDEWFARYEDGECGHRWDENVQSWLGEGRQVLGENMLIVRFEEMKTRPVETLLDVCRHLGIDVDQNKVELAVGQASLESARKIEQSRASKSTEGDASFYRGGRVGQWKEYFTDSTDRRFWELGRISMQLAGYEE